VAPLTEFAKQKGDEKSVRRVEDDLGSAGVFVLAGEPPGEEHQER
jgi:hypothetical protein